MNAHVPDLDLQRFSAGEVDDHDAVRIAVHLDDCPRCAARVAAFDPLFDAFDAVADVPVSEALVEHILHAVALDLDRRVPTLEIAIGAGLLVAACTLVLLGSDPVGIAARTLTTLPQLGQLAQQASLSIGALLLAFALFVVGSSVALRLTRRRST